MTIVAVPPMPLFSLHVNMYQKGILQLSWASHCFASSPSPPHALFLLCLLLEMCPQSSHHFFQLDICGWLQVIVVLSDELVRQPEAMLRALCGALQVPWNPAMLSWPAGPKPYDGVWYVASWAWAWAWAKGPAQKLVARLFGLGMTPAPRSRSQGGLGRPVCQVGQSDKRNKKWGAMGGTQEA